jgi:hypothetical protein
MFSIINTGVARALVWYSPGSRAISSLAPSSAHPVTDPRDIPEPSPIPLLPPPVPPATTGLAAPTGSHTPASTELHASSHTQEFPRWGQRGRDRL